MCFYGYVNSKFCYCCCYELYFGVHHAQIVSILLGKIAAVNR